MTKQKIDIIGRVGKKPETRTTQSGKTVTKFSLAVSEKYKGEESTTWFNCVAWDKAGQVIEQYVNTGDLLNVEGKIRTDKYQDNNGQERHVWEVVVREFTLLGARDKQQPGYNNVQNKSNAFDDAGIDTPF